MTWNDFAEGRAVDPATFVAAASTLLESAVAAAGGGQATRADFIAGLEAGLSTSGPYATLRLDAGLAGQEVRGELRENAIAVSEVVLDLVRSTSGTPGVPDIHSSCVGYAWIPPVVERLIAGPGMHAARNLYNEWLWQLVLLRDALIPFTDPSRVRLLADAGGLTRLQDARDWFAVQVMTRRIAHAAIVRFAAEAVTGGHAEGAYGFQHGGTVVLPPVAFDGELLGPAYLLSPHEGALVAEGTAYFVQGQEDGETASTLSAPAREIGDVEVVGLTDRLVPGPPGPGATRTLSLVVGFDGHEWAADLGRALRGHRYAARPAGSGDSRPTATTVGAWSGCAVLRQDGEVAVPGGGVIPTGGQRALTLALLGRLRPGNVVLYTGQEVGGEQILLDIRS
ncbi:hypothetical protein ACU635_35010 [[Actinomadura] parvosata]|uniref:hypothetical protein n=1 Tax=[Actinomadura] parvosata TaxID=1955412 RepID=UPI00406CAB49